MQVCTLLQTDKHASTPLLSFLQAGCPSCRPTNSVKALKAGFQTGQHCRIKYTTRISGVASIGPGQALARPLIRQVGQCQAWFSF